MEEFRALGADLCTICPQTPEHAAKMAQANGVTFAMLCDKGNEIAASYGLRHGMPDDLRTVYLAFGIDMPKFNGDDSWTLPMAARLIIDPEGMVRHIFADPDYMTRPEPSETLELLHGFVGAEG